MSESIIADFTTRLIPDAARYAEPVRGRVLLSDRRLVLATADERVTVPLGKVFDVTYGQAPSELASFFDDTVTIGYRSGRNRQLAVVEGDTDVVRRFTNLLFKDVLNGTRALVKHPVEDPETETTLGVGDDSITLAGPTRTVIDVATVLRFERRTWTSDTDTCPVLAVRHVPDGGSAITTEIALGSERKLHILGRYLSLSYAHLESELADVTITDEETTLLAACHAGRDASLPRTLGTDASHVTMLQRGLAKKGLLADGGTELTRLGRLAASRHTEA